MAKHIYLLCGLQWILDITRMLGIYLMLFPDRQAGVLEIRGSDRQEPTRLVHALLLSQTVNTVIQRHSQPSFLLKLAGELQYCFKVLQPCWRSLTQTHRFSFIIQIEAHREMLLLLFPYSENMTEEAIAAILQPHGQKPQAKAGGSKTKSLRKLCNHYGDVVWQGWCLITEGLKSQLHFNCNMFAGCNTDWWNYLPHRFPNFARA